MVHVLSKSTNMQNVAISRCCFVNFCKQRQRNEQRIITHAYTAIVLVAVAVEVCLIKLSKTKINGKIMNSQTSRKTNERSAVQRGSRARRKQLWYETKPKHIK